jgi:hypothetical protein
VGGRQQVLDRGRTVDDPVAGNRFQAAVAADQDRHGGLGGYRGVAVDFGNLAEQLAILNDHELPRLLIAGTRRVHG